MEINYSICYLGLGSNIGDGISNIENAIQLLKENNIHTIQISSFYESEPWGYESSNSFINCCVSISTKLTPNELLISLKKIEIQLGRKNKTKSCTYSDRIIDLDIIFYSNLIVNTDSLTLPHPHFQERNFVLIPMSEICPDFITPLDKLTISQHLINSKDINTLKLVKKS